MTTENKMKKFQKALQGVLFFAMSECIKTDWLKDADIDVGYIVSDYFEDMAETVIDIKTVAEFYDELLLFDNSALRYVFTHNVDDIDISSFSKLELERLQAKIYHEISIRELLTEPLNQVLIDNDITSIGRFEINAIYDNWDAENLNKPDFDYIAGDIIKIEGDSTKAPYKILGYTDTGNKIEISINEEES